MVQREGRGSVISVLEPTAILILGGDKVVGGALESLLTSGGYRVRFFSDIPVMVGEALPGLQLVIFPPVSNAKRRDALLARTSTDPALSKLPALELITVDEEARTAEGNRVVWPCAMDRLKHEIDRAIQRHR